MGIWWPPKVNPPHWLRLVLIQMYSVLSILSVHISLKIITYWCSYLSFIYRHKIYFNMVLQPWCFAKCNVQIFMVLLALQWLITYICSFFFFGTEYFNLINAFMRCSSPNSLSPGHSFLHGPILLQLTLVLAFSLFYPYTFSFL